MMYIERGMGQLLAFLLEVQCMNMSMIHLRNYLDDSYDQLTWKWKSVKHEY